MVANAEVPAEDEPAVDTGTPRLTAQIGEWSHFMWTVPELRIAFGPQPSHALINIPTDGLGDSVVDDDKNIVAFGRVWQNAIKIGTVGTVYLIGPNMNEMLTVFRGKVVAPYEDADLDQKGVLLYDARWDLQSVKIFGAWISTPLEVANENDPSLTYRQGWPPIFNPGGRPNCIYNRDTKVPTFTPYPDYGLDEDDEVPEPESAPQNQATYWTLAAILRYLRAFYGPDAEAPPKTGYYTVCGDDIIWPETLGGNIDAEAENNFDQAREQNNEGKGRARKGREMNLEGLSVMEAIQAVLDSAGGYAIHMQGREQKNAEGETEYKNVLQIVPTRALGSGLPLNLAAAGAAKTTLKNAILTGGSYEENGAEIATAAVVMGSKIFLEQRLSTEA